MALSVLGKTAILTGAGSGIQLSFANLLLSRGCNVLFADLSLRPEAKATISKYSSGSPRAVFQKTDVVQWPELERMFVVAEREFGKGVDLVVPGAGIYEPRWSNFWHPPGSAGSRDNREAGGYALLDINLSHPIRATQLAISHFLERGKPGSVVHISSIAAQASNPVAPLYNASKAAISCLVRSLGPLEAAHGIRVTAVAPGVIKTPLWTEAPEHIVKVSSVDKWATPEEVANAMLDLVERDNCSAGKIAGGTILEVGAGQTRLVEERNDPGPSGPGCTVEGNAKAAKDILESLGKGWGT